MIRREFLTKAIFNTAGILVARKSLANSFVQAEKCDCLVIGAGMAGITAAKDLAFPQYSRKGFKTIVLEASGRIGGRIFSLPDPRMGGNIELGAEHLHRKPGSVALWKEIDFYKPKIEKISRMKNGLMYYDGWENNLRKEWELLKEWNIWDVATFSRKIDKYKGRDVSAKQWLDRQNYSRIGRNMVDLFLTGHVPGRLEEISIKGFAADRVTEQNLEMNEYKFVDGYNNFVEQMAQGIELHKGKVLDIRFRSVVNYIRYGSNGVEVRTTDGRVFLAKAVILTASIGMIKSGEIVFDPPLPEDKTDALNCIGMGDEAKLVLKFHGRFWPKKAVFLNRIDNHHEMGRTYFIPFSADEEKNRVLSILFAGAEADKIRPMTDLDVIKACCRDLDKMFPSAAPTYRLLVTSAPDVPVYLRWQWSNDPYAKGADSFLKFGMERSIPVTKARKTLAHPGSTPGLFWAGEATATGEFTQPCSSHGAHFSGARAAVEVAQFIRLRNV